ncbi:glucosylglycerate hydrolase [Stackebrandtia nassauensis]|uniref:Mannosylglycerate hydrolase MGH1-like glycoside hydrolase domain-containing protein n=1 Tax=Stackebrandtia nassauensis (strain DSM 44728 / CIP 108903 / NRRL B-16338 / NBRC 102104 / LLR-40K-21) TaxID=446470 RepID=D3Q1P1_STANL|nr:hypothetical protein [Stackebrandtia nassauensis]ADD39889.1 conserved hypothetical protein [Stackebrandtia nassauensis DSM 44728]
MTVLTGEALADRAADVLRGNDLGDMTAAAPRLYPHMWSWDSALIAVGLARISVPRAITEMRTLLRAQWTTGMIPHIVFSDVDGYFPGPDRWRAHLAPTAPSGVRTSGICQPPVHAIALRHILDAGRRSGGTDQAEAERFISSTFDSWLNWHRWLATARDPDGLGLVEIHHGWESGMDNSPRWDDAYARITPGTLEAFTRLDTRHVADVSERPSDTEYARYLWLIEQMRRADYDETAMRSSLDFRVADVFTSAILAVASDVLADLGDEFDRTEAAAELRDIAARFRAGVASTIDSTTGLARDLDRHDDEWIDADSVAGFAPLLSGGDVDLIDRQREIFWGPRWCGHPDLAHRLPASLSPAATNLRPKTYWRGPVWPFLSWLFGWGLRHHGHIGDAEAIREAGLAQLTDGHFGEYYEPFTGEALGSHRQSWTAAVALDWLA